MPRGAMFHGLSFIPIFVPISTTQICRCSGIGKVATCKIRAIRFTFKPGKIPPLWIFKIRTDKIAATMESQPSNTYDAVGDRNTCETAAIIERPTCYCLCPISNDAITRKRCTRHNQTIANVENIIFPIAFIIVICGMHERTLPNACDAIGNYDAYKTATIECPNPNACDAVGNYDAE